jgi:beta-lactamase class D
LTYSFLSFTQEVRIDSSFYQKYVLSNLKGEYIVYDLNQRITFASSGALNQKFTVGSSLFPYISLIAIESGAVRSDDQECIRMLKNEGVNFSAVLQRQTDYFIQLMELIGKDKLSTWLSKINFGHLEKETFNGFPYLNNCLKISLEEQLLVLKSLYFFNLPFSYQSMIEVKKIFQLKRIGEKELHFFEASGVGQTWLMGWFTLKKQTCFFVQHTEIMDDKSTSFRTPFQLLGDLLYRLGYIESEECTQLGF